MLKACKTVSILTLLYPAFLFAQIGSGSQISQPAAPASTSPEQRCTLQGRVTNSLTGEPVKKATVRLAPRRVSGAVISAGGSNGLQGYAATSEADGSFRFENLDPGEYTLSGRRAGFLNTNYGAKSPLQPGTTLALRPGQQMDEHQSHAHSARSNLRKGARQRWRPCGERQNSDTRADLDAGQAALRDT